MSFQMPLIAILPKHTTTIILLLKNGFTVLQHIPFFCSVLCSIFDHFTQTLSQVVAHL